MKIKRGKTVAIGAVAVGLVVLAAAGVVLWNPIREEWWIHQLGSEDAITREVAAEELGAMGYTRATPRLLEVFVQDEQWNVREAAGRAIIYLGPQAVPYLARALNLEDIGFCLWSLSLLERMGARASEAVPTFLELLPEETHIPVRFQVVLTLRSMGPAASPAVPAMIELLDIDDPDLQEATAEALGEIGPAARAAVPKLKALQNSKHLNISEAARDALKSIEKPDK